MAMSMPCHILRQLEELQLIQCSLLPGELLTFIDEPGFWNGLLEGYPEIDSDVPGTCAHFKVHLSGFTKVWFDIELSGAYPEKTGGTIVLPNVSVKGDSLNRQDQERWRQFVDETWKQVAGSEYPLYELISLNVLPLLHAEIPPSKDESDLVSNIPASLPAVRYHALLTSHHLISPNKRRSLQHWSSSLAISGFAKVGYPGVIYAEGVQNNVEEFVGNIKAMQWLALRVRFVEPVPTLDLETNSERRWSEFQKVGEVVEEMKRLGREEFILEMGIGSAGTSK